MESQNYSYIILKFLIKFINLYIIISVIICKKEPVMFNKNINIYKINFFSSSKNDNINLFFNLSFFEYSFSYKFNIVELEYNFQFFDGEKNLIIPSNLYLYYNLHVFCFSKQRNSNLKSISNIYKNEFFNCLEYLELNERAKFGIIICYGTSECRTIYLFNNKIFNLNTSNIKLFKIKSIYS